MSFGEHLDELRRRLILALIPPIPLFLIYFWFGEQIRSWMAWPLVRALERNQLPAQLQTLSPVETVMTDLKLGIVLALVTAAPWILWQGWCFVAPGLYRHEQRFIRFLFPASAFLTLSGVTILYFLALPLLLTMLVSFGISRGPRDIPAMELLPPLPHAGAIVGPDGALTPEGGDLGSTAQIPIRAEHPTASRPGDLYIKVPENVLCVPVAAGDAIEVLTVPMGRSTLLVQQFRLSEYISFVLLMTASVAAASQMPLAILLLGWLGILSIETLRTHRKHALLICAILAAVLTPTADMVTMVAAMVPLYLLYELGVLLLWLLPATRFTTPDDAPTPVAPTVNPRHPVPATGTVARGTMEPHSSDVPPFVPEHEDDSR